MPKPINPADEVRKSDLREDEGGILLYDDQAALKIVLDDTERADSFMNVNQWASQWTQSTIIYQSPTTAFDGNMDGANAPMYTLSNHISAIVPKILGGLFYEDPCFLLRPRPGTPQDVTRAKTALFTYQLDDMEFQEEVERGLEQMALLGTGIWKRGWYKNKKKLKKYVRKSEPDTVTDSYGKEKPIHTDDSDDFEIEYEEQQIHRPWFKAVDIRCVLVETGCRVGNIQKAKHVVYRDYATYENLDDLRDQEGYDIPSEDELRDFFMRDREGADPDNMTMTLPEGMRGWLQSALPRNYPSSADPLANSLEILERWDNNMVIVVLRHGSDNILIRNEANVYGKIPFYSANWRNIPDSFYGQGLGQLIGSEQLITQGVRNLGLGLLGYGLQPTAVRAKGFNTPTQDIRWKQGGIIDVEGDDVTKAFKFLEMPSVPSEAWQFIQNSSATAQETSGANEQVTLGAGSAGVHTTGMRTATGAAGVISANASRLDGPIGRFTRQVFVPWLYDMDSMNNDWLPTSVLRQVLSEEMGEELELDHVAFRNARIKYEVLAGSHLGPKKEMAQFLPFAINLINNPTFAQMIESSGYMFDAVAVFKAFADAAGWKYSQDFIRKMTQPEQDHAQANSPARIAQMKAQAGQQQQQQKFQQDEQLENSKQLGKASNEVLRQAIEQATTSEVVQGEPGNSGFGSEDVG